LTKIIIDDILFSMNILENIRGNDTALIYAGLSQISGRGRKTLKRLAQSLVFAQNNPGYPVPESISQQIKRELETAGAHGGDSLDTVGVR
jgi:hypothetical protein